MFTIRRVKNKSSHRMRGYFENLNKWQETFLYDEEFLSKMNKEFLQISKKRQLNKIRLSNEKLGASLKYPNSLYAYVQVPSIIQVQGE